MVSENRLYMTLLKSEDRLTEYAMEIQHAPGPKRSNIRRSKYYKLDKALHLWFLQKQAMGMPVSAWANFNS